MARGPAKIPPEELRKLIPENKKWFEIYENHAKAPTTKEYRDKVRSFLEYKLHNQEAFSLLDRTDVSNFIAMLERVGFDAQSTDTFISAISGCAKILHKEYPDTFTSSWLDDLLPERKNADGKSTGKVLTLEQISLIKKYTFEQGNKVEQYIFNKLFCEGTKLEEIQGSEKEGFAEDVDFIDEANKYFSKITRYIEKKTYKETARINSAHFKLSHQKYFFPCPFCQKKIENIAENWILVRTEYYDEYRLVHADCKERIQ
jgi:hypothetical protein